VINFSNAPAVDWVQTLHFKMVLGTILRWREAGSTPAWCTMKETLARREFKALLGQANHFLVTTLIALDCLDKNSTHQAPGLHAAWSPKNIDISIKRSRVFVLHSFLAAAVDALDVYVALLNRKPDFLQDSELSGLLQACGRSVYQKATVLSEWVNKVDPPQTLGPAEMEAALVEVLITWRNNVQHELADNTVSSHAESVIKTNSASIGINYCNLDPSGLSRKANSGSSLTFKEAASLINAVHKYVELVDAKILACLDKQQLMEATLTDTLKAEVGGQGFRVRLFDVDAARWSTFVSNWAQNTLHFPPLESSELEGIRAYVLGLKEHRQPASR